MKSGVFAFIFLAIAHPVLTQDESSLVCHDCDPKNNPEGCKDPVKNSVQQTNCGNLYPQREANSTLICLSAYITFFGDQKNKTGIYRGCNLQTSAVVDFCELFKQETDSSNALLVSCVPCKNHRCNSISFGEAGQPNNSTDAIRRGLVALLVTVLFSTLF